MTLRQLPTLLFSALLLSTPPLFAKSTPKPPESGKEEISNKKGDLQEIRDKIQTLNKEISTGENQRNDAADQLKKVEQDISGTQRSLRELTTKKDSLSQRIEEIHQESKALEQRQEGEQKRLNKLLYRQYVQGNPDSLRLLLKGNDPNQLARTSYYLWTIGKARTTLLAQLQETLREKQLLEQELSSKKRDVDALAQKEQQAHEKLLSQRSERKQLLNGLSSKLAEQRKQVNNLRQNEKQLSLLIDKLAKAAEAREAEYREAQRREAAREKARERERQKELEKEKELEKAKTKDKEKTKEKDKPVERLSPPPKQEEPEKTKPVPEKEKPTPQDTLPAYTPPPRQEGNFRPPVQGTVSNRFATPRLEGTSWKGIFIKAAQGADVKAIGNGRVVFADWMRGFGNLIIIDHGKSLLSIYGNNEAVFKSIGDNVRAGDVIANVGNSGGNAETGLYFEIRHQGKPTDPLQWVNLK